MLLDVCALELGPSSYHRARDYFGIWGMFDHDFDGLLKSIASSDLVQHEQASARMSPEEKEAARKYALELQARELSELLGVEFSAAHDSGLMVAENGLAVIALTGTLMKSQSSYGDSTSTVDARRKVRAAGRDPSVKAALFLIDSPGGTVAGTQEFSDDVAALQAMKPTAAQIEDMGASAAYWPAAQTGLIALNRGGMAGSIGVLNVVVNRQRALENAGLSVEVYRSGPFKGAGAMGTAATDQQRAHWQHRVDTLHAEFAGAVGAGRKLAAEQVAAVADGRVFVGQEAKDAGLVDAIQSLDATVSQLMERANPKGKVSVPVKGKIMSEENAAPKGATLAELKVAFPNDAAFVLKQLEAGATLDAAKGAWAEVLQARLDAKEQELADEKARNKKQPGVDPFLTNGKGADGGGFDDPKAEFTRLKAERMEKFKEDPLRAGAEVARRNPELHRAYLLAINTKRSAKQDVLDRADGLTV